MRQWNAIPMPPLSAQQKAVERGAFETLVRAAAPAVILALVTQGIGIGFDEDFEALFARFFAQARLHQNTENIPRLVRDVFHQLACIPDAGDLALIVAPDRQHAAFRIGKTAYPFQIFVPPRRFPLDLLIALSFNKPNRIFPEECSIALPR